MALTIFLPVRKGSERVSEKNTRKFGSFHGGLLELKLNQLIRVENADEVVISTNDEKCMEIVHNFTCTGNLKIVERPDYLGKSDTNLSDLIRYVPEIVSSDDILWTHVTSPFCDTKNYSEIISVYENKKKQGYDSLVTGTQYKEFLIDEQTRLMINNSSGIKWPRTQDLANLFQVNNAVFIASRKQYQKGDRMGEHPFFMNMNKINSLDIDNEEDFKIAEAVYERIFK